MYIDLNNTEQLISVILASVSVIAFLFRKVLKPAAKKIRQGFGLLGILRGMREDIHTIKNTIAVTEYITRDLLTRLPVAIYITDMSGGCVWTNTALQTLFGANPSEMLKDGWLNFLHPDDIASTFEKWHHAVQKRVPYKARYRIIRGGQTIECEATADFVLSPEGELLCCVGEVIPT